MHLNIKESIKIMGGDLLHLIFPNSCLICEKEISLSEKMICSFCDHELPVTNYQHFEEHTEMDRLFWGRMKTVFTYTHLFFEKNSSSQKILFQLKYKNGYQLGHIMGERMGRSLQAIDAFKSVDSIIPVPLHPKKEFIRGYNQSRAIAEGISSVSGVPVKQRLLERTSHTASQTKKGRFDRWDNVHSIFRAHQNLKKQKHVLLIDDVITTGSTIESCCLAIRKINPDISISVATLAIA